MARIPEAEIERLKQDISLQRLVENRGVSLNRHGADLVGNCPFHDDKEPSLVISPKKNLWHCMGACQAGGSVIDWVMRSEGVSFRHAVELLRSGAELTGRIWAGRVTKQSTVPAMPSPLETEAEDTELLGQVIEYYHQTLKESPETLAYLEDRGLKSSEMVERFRLGYANRTLGYRLPAKNRQEGARIRGRLQELGILRESGHEHFRGSLVIPVFDEQGRVVEVYGRKVTRNLRKGTPDHLYLPGPHRGVWNLEALVASQEIILCESLIDALTFWCAGFRNVTASYGIEGFTSAHLEAFKRHGTKLVLIAYDRDEAGDRAAEGLAERLMDEGLDCYRVQFPKGMDANEYAQKVQPAERSLGVLIRSAAWLGKGRFPNQGPLGGGTPTPEPAAKEESPLNRPPAEPDPKPHSNFEPEAPKASPASPPGPEEAEGAASLLAAEVEPRSVPGKSTPVKADTTPKGAVPPRGQRRLNFTEGEEVTISLGDRRWRIRGLAKNLSFEQLKVNVLVARVEDPSVSTGVVAFHVDTFDLYGARQRSVFVKQAAEELGVKEEVVKKDLGKVLLKLEELQEEHIRRVTEPEAKEVILTDEEKRKALELLKAPDLLDRILGDFEKCGVVGEETNKLVGYLAAISRKLEEPLAVVIQSSSAAGKTSLMEAVMAFVPPEQRVQYSAMTGQSLFYMGECDLKHKILAIVEEEGAERASYALKLLQSEGQLTIASTGKDPTTGRLVTHEYHVQGPVMIFLTTTAIEVDEELLNRCIVLTVCEDREQTKRIHRLQRNRQTLQGLLARQDREETLKVHQDAQRLLRRLLVANPYAPALTFTDSQTRTRRDHMKYLTLIRTVALLHQYQRPIRSVPHNGRTVQYIEVTKEDIQLANRLAHDVLGRSLDELPPQTRRLLLLLDEMVTENCEKLSMDRSDYRFTRRTVREHTGWGNTQLKIHLERLADMEYLAVHPRGQAYHYELVYQGEGQDQRPFMTGLIDVEKLERQDYDENRSGSEANRSGQIGQRSGTGRPPVGAWSGGGRGVENEGKASSEDELEGNEAEIPKNALKGKAQRPTKSYVLIDPPSADTSLPLAAKGQGAR